jgi:EAL domain-containing protein (putative c-di-GMP-specific phosphodiesterase class I)
MSQHGPARGSEEERRSLLHLLVVLRASGHAADEGALALLAGLPLDDVRARVVELRSSAGSLVSVVSGSGDRGACARSSALWVRIAAVSDAEVVALRDRLAREQAEGRLRVVPVDGPSFGEHGLVALAVGRPADAKDRALREVRAHALRSACQTLWYCSIDEDWQLSAVPFGHEILSRPPPGGPEPWSIGHLIDAIADDDDALREFDLACLSSAARYIETRRGGRERFFVNVLPHTLLHEGSRREMERLLGSTRPGDIVLELSERFPADLAAMTAEAARLEAQGLWLAIDDWGVAGGDLDKLDAWAWTYVKVAGQFADISRRRASRPVLEALVRAHAASLVVEGVEPGWHEDFLLWYAAGARIFQCFLLSEPADEPQRAPRDSDLFRPGYLEDVWRSREVSPQPPAP